MKMSLRPDWAQTVEVHGHRVERILESMGSGEKANWLGTDFAARPGLDGYDLTESEQKVAEAIKDTFFIKRLRRPSKGVDFIFGNVGFEAKSLEYYSLSETQKECINVLEKTFIIISDGTGPYIKKMIE